jgi:alkylation response protein AidB-like acyl-CoA dehydrogenase/GNAT superfamily N-acetyltransferase
MSRSPEAQALHCRYYQLAHEAIRPAVRANDDAHAFDRDAWRRLGGADFFRLPVARELGGLGCPPAQCAAALEGLVEGSADLGFSVSAVAHWVALLSLQRFGCESVMARYLPRLLSGEWVAAVANAEPQAGTNLMAIASHALRTPNGFDLHTRKQCITNVGVADLMLVSARLRDVSPRKEVNIFLVEKTAPGVAVQTLNQLTGLRTSCTGDLVAQPASLPADALLGEVGSGLEIFRTMFTQERLWTGVLYLAALRACQERALDHAETRLQFGRPIGRNQYVQDRIVRMSVAEQLLRSLLAGLLASVERGEDVSDALSVVKIHGVDAAIEASESLVRLLGGRGVSKTETAEKFHRDLLALSILGGTVELQKIVLYQELARRWAAAREPDPPTWPDLSVTIHDTANLEPVLEGALVDLTARLFPGEAALAGKFYYDTRPDIVLAAWKENRLAGFRVLTRRQIDLNGTPMRIAGLGIGVEPTLQRQGIGTMLTRRALELLRELGDDLAVAILLTPNAEHMLQSFGFARIKAQVTYVQREGGEMVVESMPVLALDLHRGTLLEDINGVGRLHLGTGTW